MERLIQELMGTSKVPTSFQAAHIILALILFTEQSHPLGRYELSRELGLSDASTRTILKRFKEKNIIKIVSRREGHRITEEGKALGQQILAHMRLSPKSFELGDFTVGRSSALVRLIGKNIRDRLIQIRDAAIKAEALGCTAFLCTEKGFIVPGYDEEDFLVEDPIIIRHLESLNPNVGDWILAGTASLEDQERKQKSKDEDPSFIRARIGAVAAAMAALKI
ncbi:MAG: DUF4443 domain-containing protein [Candidatus Hodarchaeota archaeon]